MKGFPTLYLHTAAGENIQYEGDRSKADLIEFVNKNRSNPPKTGAVKDELWAVINTLIYKAQAPIQHSNESDPLTM